MKTIVLLLLTVAPVLAQGELLFQETFEDTLWTSRGWYDGVHMEIVDDRDAPEGDHVMEWHWTKAGAIGPSGGGARLLFPIQEDVTLGFWMKVSDNWGWTGRPFHPHMFSILTNIDDKWVGPSWTHLTTYAEVVNGNPRVAIQDGRNVDTSRVKQDLTGLTDVRSIAGCNGDSDGHGEGDCYQSGGTWNNGKIWETETGLVRNGQWHEMRARYRLNSINDGETLADGVLQIWFDGQLVIDVHDAVLRTARHEPMRFNQLLLGPYFGPGVPHAQTMWIDDVRVWAGPPPVTAVQPTSWGRAKIEGAEQP